MKCAACSKPAQSGNSRCAKCVRLRALARERALAAGICPSCQVRPLAPLRRSCAQCLNTSKQARRRLRQLVLDHYGRACTCCGESEELFLEIDHIENDGAAHRKEIGVSGQFYGWLRRNKFPPGYTTLCANCNHGKQRNGGICPHKYKRS